MTTVMTPRIGVRFEPGWAPERLPDFARWAEDAGFDELWFSEDLPWAGGIAMAATALAVTTRIHVGIGLLPAVTRNVATAAMEIAALARLAPGRLSIALGHGIPSCLLTVTSIGDNRAAALDRVRTKVQELIDLRVYDNLSEIAGLGADGSGPLTDEILQSLAIAGTAEDAARTVNNWAEAGADCVVIVAGDDDPEESYRRFATDVFPLLGR